MKKSLVLVLIVLLAASAFGQISFGAWGRGVLAIGSMTETKDDGSVSASVGIRDTKSWGGNGSRIGYNMYGKSDNVGYQLAFDNDGTSHTLALANIWVKPVDMVKLTIGSYNNHTLRGNAEFGSWNWLRIAPGNLSGQYSWGVNNRWGNDSIGEDLTFARNCARDGGFLVEVTPMEELYVFAAPLSGPDGGALQSVPSGSMQSGALLSEALSAGQYGFGYTIAGIGQVKAQFIGVNEDADAYINAAFKLTAVQGLMAEVGVFVPTDTKQILSDVEDATQIAAYAKYTGVENMTLHVAGVFYMFDEYDDANVWEGAVGLDYRINDQLMLNSDVRLYSEDRNMHANADGDAYMGWAASANVSKGLAAGKVGIGLEITNVGFAADNMGGEEGGDFLFAIPLILEYSF